MAYVLGFIAADGSLEDASYLRGKYLRISSTDFEVIEKIKNVMNSEHSVVTIGPQNILGRKKNYISKQKYLLRIGSHEIYNDLFGLGIEPRKSKTLTMPKVPLEFMACFLRGYLDGDGCIHASSGRKRLSAIFTSGSRLFLEAVSKNLSFILGINDHNIYSNNRAFQLRYSTRESIVLLNYIYSDISDGLFLSRKYKIYLEFLYSYLSGERNQNNGAMAEKLGSGLQNRAHRCDSGSRLQ